MKKLLFFFILFFSVFSTCFADEQEVVDSFKALVEPKINTIEATYENTRPLIKEHKTGKNFPSYYTKKEEVLEYDIDVQKTDSLIKPYRGIVKIARIVYSYGNHYSYESAQFASSGIIDYSWRASIFYDYIDGKWQADFYEYVGTGNTRFRENGDKIYSSFEFNEDYLK